MKKILLGTLPLVFFGSLSADWDSEGWQDREAGSQQTTNRESSYQQSTARQPSIGDSSYQLEKKTYTSDYFEQGDWTDLNNEEMYGAF